MTEKIEDSRDLRDRVLRGDSIPLDAFRDFVTRKKVEDLYLDFKSSGELTKNDAKDSIRQHLAAFANSDGGTLAIGMREPEKEERLRGASFKEDPISASIVAGLDQAGFKAWIAQVTRDLVSHMGMPARTCAIEVSDNQSPGYIFLVSVARSPSLTPVITKGRMAYFFRVEDQSREVPSTLVADLLLGRRAVPLLVARAEGGASARSEQVSFRSPAGMSQIGQVCEFSFSVKVTNDSLVDANDVACGLLYLEVTESWDNPMSAIPDALLSQIDLQIPETMPHKLSHYRFRWKNVDGNPPVYAGMRSFETRYSKESVKIRAQMISGVSESYFCAMYLQPKDCAPLWFQVAIPYHPANLRPIERFRDGFLAGTENATVKVTVQRVVGIRPKITVNASAAEAD